MSLDRLNRKVIEMKSPVCVGLDPDIGKIPPHIKDGNTAAAAVYEFNKGIIDAVHDIVPCVKPQAAYYEALGAAGVKALSDTIAYAKKRGLYVIVDGKRNDIGATMAAYAAAYLSDGTNGASDLSGDSLTVNGYLGYDGIKPAVELCKKNDKSIFVLVKTSNPSSGELQDLVLADSGERVYERMGRLVRDRGAAAKAGGRYGCVGAVVGATYPAELERLREIMPDTFFLIPGFGAQGGTADGVKPAFDTEGGGAVVNNSRGVLYAYSENGSPREYAAAARAAVIDMIGKLRG